MTHKNYKLIINKIGIPINHEHYEIAFNEFSINFFQIN